MNRSVIRSRVALEHHLLADAAQHTERDGIGEAETQTTKPETCSKWFVAALSFCAHHRENVAMLGVAVVPSVDA